MLKPCLIHDRNERNSSKNMMANHRFLTLMDSNETQKHSSSGQIRGTKKI